MTPQDASCEQTGKHATHCVPGPPSRSLRRISAPKFFIADLDSSSSSNSTSPDASWTEDESKTLIIDTPANARKVSSVFSEMDQSYTGLADGEANEENAGKGKCSSFAYADMIQNYQSGQNTGIRLLVWICDPAAECPIQATSLSWSHLQEDQWDISQQLEGLPTVYLGSNFLPDDLPGIHTSSATAHSYRWTAIFKYPPTQPFNSCRWIGRTAEGVIFLEEISRPERHGYPFMSEITKAIYQRDFDLDGLRYVLISHVANSITRGFLIDLLPCSNTQHPQVWETDTPEFQILIGTPLGKVVAHLILNAFPRGTRRIARMLVWFDSNTWPHLRFDIERC